MKDYKHLQAGIVLVRDGADGETNARIEWKFGKRKFILKSRLQTVVTYFVE